MREGKLRDLERDARILEQKFKRLPQSTGSEEDLVIVFQTDFNDPTFAEWDQKDYWELSSISYHGSYSAKQSNPPVGTSTFLKTLSTKYPVLYCRFFIRFSGLTPPVSRNLAYFYDYDGSGSVVWLYILKDNGNTNFRIYNTVLGNSAAGSVNIQNDTWYCVEVRAEIAASANLYLYINGTLDCSLSGNTSGQGTGIDTIEIAPNGWGINWTDFYIDYLVAATARVGCL